MIVLPAIDIKNGQCVRLQQGVKDAETVYFKDPVEVAKRFQDQGAEYLHMVDLDGAFEGKPKNLKTIESIVEALDIPIELGGGIRNLEIARNKALDADIAALEIESQNQDRNHPSPCHYDNLYLNLYFCGDCSDGESILFMAFSGTQAFSQ